MATILLVAPIHPSEISSPANELQVSPRVLMHARLALPHVSLWEVQVPLTFLVEGEPVRS